MRKTVLGLLIALATLTACGSSHHNAARAAPYTDHLSWTKHIRIFGTPGQNGAYCEMGRNEQDSLGRRFHEIRAKTYVYCNAGGPEPRQMVSVSLNAGGRVRMLCHTSWCIEEDALADRMLAVGQSVGLGPFRCTALAAGTRCVIAKTGRGFLVSIRGMKRI